MDKSLRWLLGRIVPSPASVFGASVSGFAFRRWSLSSSFLLFRLQWHLASEVAHVKWITKYLKNWKFVGCLFGGLSVCRTSNSSSVVLCNFRFTFRLVCLFFLWKFSSDQWLIKLYFALKIAFFSLLLFGSCKTDLLRLLISRHSSRCFSLDCFVWIFFLTFEKLQFLWVSYVGDWKKHKR